MAARAEIGRLHYICYNMQLIKNFDLVLYKTFKSKMRKFFDRDEFLGVRFEMEIASMLIEKQVNFSKSESPDFKVWHNNNLLGIECTSSRVRVIKQHSISNYRVVRSIIKKSKKDYFNLETALFLDMTNIEHYHMRIGISETNIVDFKAEIQELLIDKSIGAVILFVSNYNDRLKAFGQTYNRIDNPNLSDKLAMFLNDSYPYGFVNEYVYFGYEG